MSSAALELTGLRRRTVPSVTVGRSVWRDTLRRTTARLGVALLAVVVLFLVVAPLLSGDSVYAQDGVQLGAPSADHLFGTDQLGRDVLIRLAAGGRRTVLGALVTLVIAVAVGLIVGVGAAAGGRRLDAIVTRAIDAVNGIPPLIVPIALVGVLGASFVNLLMAIVISYVPSYARIARTFAIGLRSRGDIVSAQLLGVGRARIAASHVLPTVFTQMLVIATLDLGSVIVSLSGLSFLGLGAQAPTPEWGVLLADGQMFFTVAPWLLLAPAVAVTLMIVGSNLIGEAMRDTIAEREGR